MTNEQFNSFWQSTYPDTKPISYFFRRDYPDRWFRIHSLPESKRYAEDEIEWDTLLTRQNQIVTDLLENQSNILLVTGEYNWGTPEDNHIVNVEEVFKPYTFNRLDNIDLYKIKPDEYDKGQVYRPAIAETIWTTNKHDKLLIEIANYKVSAFIISIEKCVIIAPYDGGIDFILKDSETRNNFKKKYKEWLSAREDGL